MFGRRTESARSARTHARRSGIIATSVFACVAALGMATAQGAAAADNDDRPGKPIINAPQPKAVETVYPEDPAARDFNTGPAGWSFFQEYSAGCWVRGGSCPKIDGEWKADGGPDGDGDGYLQFHGNSAAVYGFPWGQGSYADWASPWFTYTSEGAKSWTLEFDWKSSHVNYAIGWNGLTFEIRNEKNQVVRTAVPAMFGVPTNRWRHMSIPFDGSRETFVVGQKYRIHAVGIDYYGPSAATLGHHNIDNVSMTTSTEPGRAPVVRCTSSASLASGATDSVTALLSGKPGSMCQLTEPLGDTVSPAAAIVDKLSKAPGISTVVDTGAGAFTVVDNAGGQAGAWAVGRETLPSTNPQRLYAWVDGGNVGHSADFAIFFVTYQPQQVIDELMKGHGSLPGAATGIIQGQFEAAGEVLADPIGEAMIDPSWTLQNALAHVTGALDGQGLPKDAIPIPADGSGDLVGLPDLGVPELPVGR